MLRMILITLMALVLGASSSSAHSAARSMQEDCCDEMCHDMSACANMISCHAWAATMAPPLATEFLAFAFQSAFPLPDLELVHDDVAWPIWTPPDWAKMLFPNSIFYFCRKPLWKLMFSKSHLAPCWCLALRWPLLRAFAVASWWSAAFSC